METYEHYRNCSDINNIIDNINDMLLPKGMYTTCHGRYHTMFVVNKVEYILTALSYDSRTVELGKIAALLHDIGNIAGRWNHAQKSAALTTVLLEYPVHFLPNEKKMIVQSIEDHSEGNNITSAVGAALLIADKIDISKKRILCIENINERHKSLLEVEDVEIYITKKTIIINFITTETISGSLLLNENKKGFRIAIKAAEHLGCTCHFQFNGIEEKFA